MLNAGDSATAVPGLDWWCGDPSLEPLRLGWALSPCYAEPLCGMLLVLALTVSLLVQRSVLSRAAAARAAGVTTRGTTVIEGAFVLAAGLMAATHALHLTLALTLARLQPFHFHAAWHAVALCVWATVGMTVFNVSRVRASLDLRPLSVTAAAAYALTFAVYIQMYIDSGSGGAGGGALPVAYIKAGAWAALLQAVLCCSLVVMDAKRGAAGMFKSGAYAQLAGSDAEAATGDSDEPRTWIMLFWEAVSFMWPRTFWLRARMVGCMVVLAAVRALNIAVPIAYKHMIDQLAAAGTTSATGNTSDAFMQLAGGLDTGAAEGAFAAVGAGAVGYDGAIPHPAGWASAASPSSLARLCRDALDGDRPSFHDLLWPWGALYLSAVFFQGGGGGGMMGLMNNLRSMLYIPVGQDAYKRISLRVFTHVMDLDLAFHLHKKTGEVTSMVNRGSSAMQGMLSTVLFSIVPQFVDVLVSSTYLAQALDPTIAIIMFVTVASYMPLTVIITEWRGKLRREVNRADQATQAKVTDALINYEAVKLFSNLDYETQRYGRALAEYQAADYTSSLSYVSLNTVQALVMFCGTSSGLLVCLAAVSRGEMGVGDTVLYLAMMAQLYQPLAFFGMNYRVIQTYMIDMENLLNLLDKRTGVPDVPGAKEMVVTKGEVVYSDVTFGYDPTFPVLKNVSFVAPGGRTVAFVGATGSGKSTLTRLLFRFYDVTSGSLSIDGQDLRSVTQASLRRAVGVVPQDTVLFHDTVMNNIRYGNVDASDDDVIAAAKSARIHEAITTRFPEGYDTIVGERGLRLSGGEKQRVAFARAILKNAPIMVLDEATSALDSITEKAIQDALLGLRADRTTLIVAHRLSTIADADLIIVMRLGEVCESGRHSELLGIQGGLYAQMWAHQTTESGGQETDTEKDSRYASAASLQALVTQGGDSGDAAAPPPRRPPPRAAQEPVLDSHHGHGHR